MDLGLSGKVALVTGASRGLGRATLEALVGEGVKVLAVARSSDALAELEALHPGKVRIVAGDLRNPELPQRVVAEACAAYGRLDIAIVNTPGPHTVQPLEASDADFEKAFDGTFFPAVRLVRASAQAMKENGWGRIVIVSSTSVKSPKPFLCLSAAARSALWAWAKSAVPTLSQDGITINAMFAGPHATERAVQLGVKGRPLGTPEDFGNYVASLCGDATRFVTGTGYIVDGGELTGI